MTEADLAPIAVGMMDLSTIQGKESFFGSTFPVSCCLDFE